ncbi:MAG: hypothetical protein CMM07_13370 [Rhodopirellula sp.]|nr:hypothetical protein [Rhodopirellula sp.]
MESVPNAETGSVADRWVNKLAKINRFDGSGVPGLSSFDRFFCIFSDSSPSRSTQVYSGTSFAEPGFLPVVSTATETAQPSKQKICQRTECRRFASIAPHSLKPSVTS